MVSTYRSGAHHAGPAAWGIQYVLGGRIHRFGLPANCIEDSIPVALLKADGLARNLYFVTHVVDKVGDVPSCLSEAGVPLLTSNCRQSRLQ